MRLKHNKKRNTALVYEILIRELTESVVKKNKNKQNKIVSIIREHFKKDSTLKEELELYRSIYETRDMEKNLAEKVMLEVKERHEGLDKKRLFVEQSALINKINRTLSNKVYNNFVPNYKTIASVYSIFQDTLPVRDRVLLEENILNQMSASIETQEEDVKVPIDSLTYRTFVSKFNEEYSNSLTEGQKELLGKYVSSFSDNEIELKVYLNEEIGRLKDKLLTTIKSSKTEETIKQKIKKVYEILDETKNKQIDIETLEIVLNAQQIMSEIEDDNRR